jgi:hypothetical protein
MKWFVPCGKPNPRHGHVFQVFKSTLWLLIAAVLLLAVVVWHFLQQTELSYSPTKFSSDFLNLWAVLLGNSPLWMPSSTKLRLYLMLWAVFGMALSYVFQSLFMVEPGRGKQITTFKELVHSGMKHGMDYSGLWCPEIANTSFCLKNTKPCLTVYDCVRTAIETGDFAFPSTSLEINIVLSSLGIHHKFCFIEDVAIQLYSMSMFTKGSDYWVAVRDLTNRLAQSGLFDVFVKEYLSALKGLKSSKIPSLDEVAVKRSMYYEESNFILKSNPGAEDTGTQEEYFALSLAHLVEPMIVLLVGYTLSFITFVA